MSMQCPFAITLRPEEETALESPARKYTSLHINVIQAKAIFLATEGLEKNTAGAVRIPCQIVSKKRKRFFEKRPAGLEVCPRSGRPRVFWIMSIGSSHRGKPSIQRLPEWQISPRCKARGIYAFLLRSSQL